MYRFAALVACLLVGISGLLGCGVYSTSSGRVDERIRRVAVPYLDNLSTEPNIEIQLTASIIEALQDDNTLKVVDEGDADTILKGKVVRYRLKEVFATASQQVNEYQIQILVELELVMNATGEKIFEKKRITGSGNYILDDPDLTEADARLEAAAEIVREILALVVEDW